MINSEPPSRSDYLILVVLPAPVPYAWINALSLGKCPAMNKLDRILVDGRKLSLVSYYVRNLALSFEAGVAQEILDEHALVTVKRIWPEEPCELLTPTRFSPPQLSTQFLCIGEFTSGPIPGSGESASSLVVIWFQPALSAQFEEGALASLSRVDWNAKAKAFSW